MSAFLQALWHVTLELAPWLLLGMFVAGLMHVLIPPGWLARALTGRGGVVKAVAFGIPLPLCSCSVIPAGIGLKRDGASDGAAIGFMVATPQTGVDSILVSAGMLGWPLALWKVFAALVTGVVAGWLTDRAAPAPSRPSVVDTSAPRRTLTDGLRHANEILASIWGWLAIGVVLSAALTAWLPPGALTSLAGNGGVWAMVGALALSLPLYVCAVASVPIAAALVAGGLPLAAAIVFLMAGPATNVATIGAIAGSFGRRVVAIYLVTIVAFSLAFGFGFAVLFPAEQAVFAEAATGHVHATPWWAVGAALLLCLWGALLSAQASQRWLRKKAMQGAQDGGPHTPVAMTISVTGMTCGGCANKLTNALNALAGVEGATVDHVAAEATVVGDVALDDVRETVRRLGFDVT